MGERLTEPSAADLCSLVVALRLPSPSSPGLSQGFGPVLEFFGFLPSLMTLPHLTAASSPDLSIFGEVRRLGDGSYMPGIL